MPDLTSGQQRIVAMADDLASKFAVRAAQHDCDGSFPFENYDDLHVSGYLRLPIPPRYGGNGARVFEMVLAQERYFRDARAGLFHPPQDDLALALVGRTALASRRNS